MNNWYGKWICIYIISCCFQSSQGSYLGYPRIHFSGHFRADPNSQNNDLCNYRMDTPCYKNWNVNWNANGTAEFQFIDAKVTSVVYTDGTVSTTDPIVSHAIIDNLDQPLAKISDPNSIGRALICGLHFGIKWNSDFPDKKCNIAFHGKWRLNIITQFMWNRTMCYSSKHHGTQAYQPSIAEASQSMTTITNITWINLGESEALAQLREAVGDGALTVRVSLFYFTMNYAPYVAHNATLGYVLGVIGVPSPSDTLNVPGERGMFHKNNPVGLTFDSSDLCYKQNLSKFSKWTNFAPFEVDRNRNEVRVDLSNSLPADFSNSLRDIGTLRLGIFTDLCVYLLGSEQGLPYASTDDLPITSAIYTVPVKPSLMNAIANHSLVIVQVLANEKGCNRICGKRWTTNSKETLRILLQEYPYFIRPKDLYSHRLDRKTLSTSSQTVYVTKYGKPMQEVQINATYYENTSSPYIPAYGVIPSSWTATTDKNGLATFHFKLNEKVKIPLLRHFTYRPCLLHFPDNKTVLPVEGQTYFYYYCVDNVGVKCKNYQYIKSFFLAYSDVSYTRPYTWVKDVNPIFSQYAHITPIMRNVLDLSSYHEVTSPHNLHLLNRTLRLHFDDPAHMPPTRDLSPVKRKMILEWLEDPKYDLSGSCPKEDHSVYTLHEHWPWPFRSTEYIFPQRCKISALHFNDEPNEHDPYFSYILQAAAPDHRFSGRPLLTSKSCNIANLREQLQTAIELEWVTVPVYLTALYSIKNGYNIEIYNLTRRVIMQEMLHMTQSANILIAMNGSPLIDDARVNPSYPLAGLPGGVLPNLEVNLQKFSLVHTYQVFMGIEVPQKCFVVCPIVTDNVTIGAFYNEIKDCINYLGDDIFDPSTLDRQVKWPWSPTKELMSNVLPVTDSASAQKAITMIVSQGEGASVLNPDEISSKTLAHFFKFEEIVCQKHLEKVDDAHYAYSGALIPFDPQGVWPMRPNPKASNILPHTNCYTESRVFHQVYRMLLRKLQAVFDGRSDDIFVAVQLMESLQVHAKKLMWIKFRPDDADDDTTCGPVWDYSWPEN